ncbi:MAG: hypothetical protein RRA94_08160 [Bacteroidota bacterium]|nr:hypothetical protein [Bacteroidota bacterium]
MDASPEKANAVGDGAGNPRSELRTRLYRWTIYILIVIALGLLVWKIVAESTLQQRHDAQLTAMQEEHAAQLEVRSRDLLRAMGQMIEPAVLEGLRTQDFADLHRRFTRLRRETPVERILVTDLSGRVLVASEPQLEGSFIERELHSLLAELGKAVLDDVGEGRIRLIAPVFEQSRKRGILIIILQFAE